MAKKKIAIVNGIPVRCDYCKHNRGENKEFGYMWHCSHLQYCVVFGLQYCQARKQGKGDFEVDAEKYTQWKKNKE